ncbi:MAG: hypothetical protein JST20_11990 [Bacteroidetes bacterium]|nr:hypothetical protein [Bacteroidota bacterium]
MNRTALGIFNAYIQLHPSSTLSQLKAAFPDSLYDEVEGGFFNTIRPVGVFQTKTIVDGLPAKNLQQCHFIKDDEILKTSDGKQICVTSSWGKNALERLIKHVAQFGIIVEEIKEGESFKRGEYEITRLEENKKHTMYFIIGGLVIVLVLLFILFGRKKEENSATSTSTNEIVTPLPLNKSTIFNIILEKYHG